MTSVGDFFTALDPELFVVTATHAEERSGCLVGFATQCSIEPLRLLVAVSVLNRTFDVALSAGSLAVHLLGAAQHDVARRFGGTSGDELDKFATGNWRAGRTGSPLLLDCAAWLEGSIAERIPLGDHVGFVIDVVDGGAGSQSGALRLKDVKGLKAGHPPDELHDAPRLGA